MSADHYVLSAGAVGSSYLLLKSHAASDLPVGQRLCFNMGAPITAEFEEVQDAYAGLQISHYGVPSENGFVFETWFNPPVAQALNMPGWLEQHFENMRRYPHLGAVGVLVGTESSACAIACATRSAASSRSSSSAAPGWKQIDPTPRAVERSSSLARPARAREYFSSSCVAVFNTYAACTSTNFESIFASLSAPLKRNTRSGLIELLSP